MGDDDAASAMDTSDARIAGNEPDDVGDSMDSIYRGLSAWEQRHFPPIEPTATHSVLFKLPLSADTSQPPRPHRAPPKWDALHVRLPCSPRNQYPVSNPDGTESIKNRWALICDTLDRTIRTSHELEAAILAYNTKYARTWKFRALHRLCDDLCDEGRSFFFEVTLPGIVRLALQLPDVITAPVPLLKSGQAGAVSLTQLQCASLLANAFLCTFPRRNTQRRGSEYRTFPDINFNRLFHTPDPAVLEKLKCVLHYFARVSTATPTGVVTIARRMAGREVAEGDRRWRECGATFVAQRLHVASAGTIEDQGDGLLQVDFANKYLGGGVLGRGCVQEEIRFVICPELMVTKLVAEVMLPGEAVFVVGAERFSAYRGYAGTFTFDGEFRDETPLDEWRRRCCAIVAIDAMNFRRREDQYGKELMLRELEKAYAGWAPWLRTPAPAVATGNWGCGAFGGDKRLKALLQLMVCTVVGRPLVYFTFGDDGLRRELLEVWRWLRGEKVTVAQLWSYLTQFGRQHLPGEQLYPFLYQAHRDAQPKPSAVATTNRPVQQQQQPATPPPPPQQPIAPKVQSPPANGAASFKFSWPSAQKKKSPPSPVANEVACADEPAEQPPASATQPLPRPTFGSLLASLDADYVRDAKQTPTPSVDEPKRNCGAAEHVAIAIESPAEEESSTSGTWMVEDVVNDNAKTDEGADDDEIPATPTPPEVKKRTPHHKRQASIVDYLRERP